MNSFAAGASPGIYVGGAFDTGGPLTSGLFVDNIGLLTGSAWTALGQGVTYGENARGFGIALAHGAAGEYVGGWFNQTGSVQATGISLWNGTTWQSLGSGLAGGVSPTGPTVTAIAVNNSQVFIGGDFGSVNGIKASNIAVYSGGTWHAVGGGTDAAVDSLAINGGYLYTGGGFSKAGGASTGAPVARWKLGTAFTSKAGWSALGPLFGGGDVTSIAFDGQLVFLGGDIFDCVGEQPLRQRHLDRHDPLRDRLRLRHQRPDHVGHPGPRHLVLPLRLRGHGGQRGDRHPRRRQLPVAGGQNPLRRRLLRPCRDHRGLPQPGGGDEHRRPQPHRP